MVDPVINKDRIFDGLKNSGRPGNLDDLSIGKIKGGLL
jgi:hypothetical protein